MTGNGAASKPNHGGRRSRRGFAGNFQSLTEPEVKAIFRDSTVKIAQLPRRESTLKAPSAAKAATLLATYGMAEAMP